MEPPIDPRDLSALNYFLDAVRIEPQRVRDFADLVLEDNDSDKLKQAIEEIVKLVDSAAAVGDLEQARRRVIETVNAVANAPAAIDDVQKVALGALRGAFSR